MQALTFWGSEPMSALELMRHPDVRAPRRKEVPFVWRDGPGDWRWSWRSDLSVYPPYWESMTGLEHPSWAAALEDAVTSVRR